MNIKYPTRKAILIGCPGGANTSFLPGVYRDLETMQDYLHSLRGGLWGTDEVILLKNPNAEETLQLIQSICAEFVFVYFSGHGYTDFRTGLRMLCFNESQSVSDVALTNTSSSRLLLINDACRNYHGEGISGILLPEEEYFDFTGESSQVRYLFDQAILSSPPGITIVHGTAVNESAMDSKEGGYFTQSLLHVGRRMKITSGYQMVRIEQVLYYVPNVLKQRGNFQQPEIIYHAGNLMVPFSVAMPIQEISKGVIKNIEVAETEVGNSGLLAALGLIALGILLLE